MCDTDYIWNLWAIYGVPGHGGRAVPVVSFEDKVDGNEREQLHFVAFQ